MPYVFNSIGAFNEGWETIKNRLGHRKSLVYRITRRDGTRSLVQEHKVENLAKHLDKAFAEGNVKEVVVYEEAEMDALGEKVGEDLEILKAAIAIIGDDLEALKDLENFDKKALIKKFPRELLNKMEAQQINLEEKLGHVLKALASAFVHESEEAERTADETKRLAA